MTEFVQLLISGIATGCIFGLVGMCFVLIYRVSKVVNFAQGELVTVGALLGVWAALTMGLPFVLSLVVVAAGGAGVAAALGLIAIFPMLARNAPVFATITGTLAFATIVANIYQGLAGPFLMTVPPPFGSAPIVVTGVAIATQQVVVMVTTALLAISLWLFLTMTPTGLAVQATGVNPEAARGIGIDTRRIAATVILISGAISGVAGFVVAPITGADVNMGLALGVNGFIAGIVGGFGNPFGALAGGILVGVATAMISGYWDPRASVIAIFVIMLLILLVRPQGLFTEHER